LPHWLAPHCFRGRTPVDMRNTHINCIDHERQNIDPFRQAEWSATRHRGLDGVVQRLAVRLRWPCPCRTWTGFARLSAWRSGRRPPPERRRLPRGPGDPGSKCRRGRHVLRSIPLGLPLCRSRDATEVLDGHGRWIVGIGQRIVGEGQCCTEQPPVSVAPVMPRGGGVTLNALWRATSTLRGGAISRALLTSVRWVVRLTPCGVGGLQAVTPSG